MGFKNPSEARSYSNDIDRYESRHQNRQLLSQALVRVQERSAQRYFHYTDMISSQTTHLKHIPPH
jgi:hypothetical protein